MIAVLFESWPAKRHFQHYLDLATALRPDLEKFDGFLSVERFESLMEPGKLLSLSFWRDEAAVAAWRNSPVHRATQAEARAGIFRDYRLRIAEVSRDYGMTDRTEAPADSQKAHGGIRNTGIALDSPAALPPRSASDGKSRSLLRLAARRLQTTHCGH
ncbi:antibiotic biosynthesis monooxygenase family protein [Allosphingosinicella humi]